MLPSLKKKKNVEDKFLKSIKMPKSIPLKYQGQFQTEAELNLKNKATTDKILAREYADSGLESKVKEFESYSAKLDQFV